ILISKLPDHGKKFIEHNKQIIKILDKRNAKSKITPQITDSLESQFEKMTIHDDINEKPANHNKYKKPKHINFLSMEESIQLQKQQQKIEEEMRLTFLKEQIKVQNDSD
ncbi:7647_t:CDS:2, partial [Acaulospora morrowiae]